MDDDLWRKLTDSEKEAWQQVQNTLGSPGFKIILRDVSEIQENLGNAILNAANWDQYVYIRGQLNALSLLSNLQNRVLHQLAQAVAERTGEEEQLELDGIPEAPAENFS